MTHEPVLAHVARRLGHGAEDLATETLVHILRTDDGREVLAGLLRDVAPEVPTIALIETQAFDVEDGAIPDISAETSDGAQVLLIEVKLNAGLTVNQPVTYLERLGRLSGGTALLFLLPRRRMDSVWADVRHRCAAKDMVLTPIGAGHSADLGPTRIALVAWEDLLDRLSASSNTDVQADVIQLRGLYESHEAVGATTVDHDFLGGAVGAQLRTVTALLSESLDGLVAEGLAERRGRWAAGSRWFGKSFESAGWSLHLHVHLRRWGALRPTPLWLRVYGSAEAAPLLRELEVADPPRMLRDGGGLVVPIELAPGADRDTLRAMIDSQVRDVVERLRAHPRTSTDAAEETMSDGP